jgi:hypothetical protein
MPISFKSFLDHCLAALSDPTGVVWDRDDAITPWGIEALQAFPILRPMFYDKSSGLSNLWYFRLPDDFREIISVEYPVGFHPVNYLVRKNRLDPTFYYDDSNFDIDYDYTTGDLYFIYFSGQIPAGAHVYVQYLANHDTAMTDEEDVYLTIRDEYETILITFVMCRAYRERLSYHLQNPTIQATIISQLTDMVNHLEEQYRNLVAEAIAGLSESVITPARQVDKHDRVY